MKIKRGIDVVAALVLCILTAPIQLMIACALKVQARNEPILFCQKRPGKDGKIFTIYKFRTMRTRTHEGDRLLTDRERLFKLGRVLRKLSLDELPQLINILKGDMSFIGPRPLLVEYLDRYSKEQARRHEVLPGLTGWAQVNGRNQLAWEEKFALDVWYVDHISFSLDLKIILKTIGKVFKTEGVNQSMDETMKPFV